MDNLKALEKDIKEVFAKHGCRLYCRWLHQTKIHVALRQIVATRRKVRQRREGVAHKRYISKRCSKIQGCPYRGGVGDEMLNRA